MKSSSPKPGLHPGCMNLAVDWAQEDRSPIVITGVGGKRGDLPQQQDRLMERLRALGADAQTCSVTVALEAHNDAAVETPDQIVALLERVASPAIRANFDISHFNVLGIPIYDPGYVSVFTSMMQPKTLCVSR